MHFLGANLANIGNMVKETLNAISHERWICAMTDEDTNDTSITVSRKHAAGWGFLYWKGLTWIRAWIIDYIH